MTALFHMERPIDTTLPSGRKKDAAHRTADSYFITWERRTSLVKQQVAAESAANDDKTARLRALRLEKEAQDAEVARLNPQPASISSPRKRTKK